VRYRSGRGYDALGDPVAISVAARAPRIAIPVLLLTGRGVYSSTEEFVDAMRQEAHVTTFGDTTGGSSGNPTLRPLCDGWQFTVPRWQHRASDGRLIEDQGIAPELVSAWDPDAARAGRDAVLDSAVAYLRRRP
jgi:C-terminal processing protease CtpA/Prc